VTISTTRQVKVDETSEARLFPRRHDEKSKLFAVGRRSIERVINASQSFVSTLRKFVQVHVEWLKGLQDGKRCLCTMSQTR
jgi:hypothetical protein